MKSKSMKARIGVCCILSALCLTSCSSKEVKDTKAMTLEEVAAINMQSSVDEQENYIYSYVTDRLTVDTDSLVQTNDEDKKAIQEIMDKAVQDLMNGTKKVLKEHDANYIMYEMTRTPYQWQLEGTNILGFDASSRLYFVDVTFKTTSDRKIIIPNEKIVKGSKDYDAQMGARYKAYISVMDKKVSGDSEKYIKEKSKFESIYGKISDILEGQQKKSLVQRTKEKRNKDTSIGILTYNGIKNGVDAGATMTFRFVLNYTFNLGEATGIEIQSVYLKDYEIDNKDSVTGVTTNNIQNLEMIEPIIDSRINAYHKSAEVVDNKGLYDMFDNYADWEKYFDDNKYTINKYMSYTYKVLNRDKDKLDVLVNRVHKVRSNGSNMSFPSYNEEVLLKMIIAPGDKIKIVGETLLSSTMVGEPISVVKDVIGVSEKMMFSASNFTKENKKQVRDIIIKFSEAQVSDNSSAFIKYVDLGINQNRLTKMNEMINSMKANKKIVWLAGYSSQSNMYCNATVREVNFTDDGNYEVEYQLELANNKDGWGIVGYTVTKKMKISNANAVSDNNSICTVEKGKSTTVNKSNKS